MTILGQQQRVCDVWVMSEGGPPGNVSEARMSAARGFPLGGVVVEMGHQANPKRVRGIESFNDAQITGNFG